MWWDEGQIVTELLRLLQTRLMRKLTPNTFDRKASPLNYVLLNVWGILSQRYKLILTPSNSSSPLMKNQIWKQMTFHLNTLNSIVSTVLLHNFYSEEPNLCEILKFLLLIAIDFCDLWFWWYNWIFMLSYSG